MMPWSGISRGKVYRSISQKHWMTQGIVSWKGISSHWGHWFKSGQGVGSDWTLPPPDTCSVPHVKCFFLRGGLHTVPSGKVSSSQKPPLLKLLSLAACVSEKPRIEEMFWMNSYSQKHFTSSRTGLRPTGRKLGIALHWYYLHWAFSVDKNFLSPLLSIQLPNHFKVFFQTWRAMHF